LAGGLERRQTSKIKRKEERSKRKVKPRANTFPFHLFAFTCF
jgi:hypothetical protein